MFRALLKKQFSEVGALYFRSGKKGKTRSKGAVIGLVILFIVLFASLGVAFFGMGELFAGAMLPSGMDWLYFAMMGMIALFIGVIGDVFTAYTALYQAKDNDLLLSMPIPPAQILFSRMISVYVMGLLFEAVAWIPAMLVYWIEGTVSVASVVFPLLMTFVLAFFVLILTCVLGWLVALVASRVRNKTVISVFFSLLLIGIYYVCYFRMNELLTEAAAHTEEIGRAISTYLYPFYQLGLAGTGDVPAFFIFTGIIAAVFALVYWVLSVSFTKIVTANRGDKKAVYHEEKEIKAKSPASALFGRELRHFLSSPAYILNCGLGLLILVIGLVAAIVKRNDLTALADMLNESLPQIGAVIPVAAVAVVMLVLSMCCFSAPSVSLEGKTIWIVHTLPIPARDVLKAKENLHLALSAVPAVSATVVFGLIFGVEPGTLALMAVTAIMFVRFEALLGLMGNLRHVNLDWTNETVPIKQSVSVLISMFGGWAIGIATVVGFYFLQPWLTADWYLLIVIALLTGAAYFLNQWVYQKGTVIFDSL